MDFARSFPSGTTRSRIERHYALITPDTHVPTSLVGWTKASAVIHISPELGARFMQYTAFLEPGAASATPGKDVQRFIYVLAGSASLSLDGSERTLAEGAFAYLPANTGHQLTCKVATQLAIFEKKYCRLSEIDLPLPQVGQQRDVASKPFLGDEALSLQVFLPVEPACDMAVNRFTYQPGGTLPQVEIHRMEHGLLMLSGAGVYRLGDDYHLVQKGDVIWMASYCPQWFVAMGKEPASYLYYKDIHRDRLSES